MNIEAKCKNCRFCIEFTSITTLLQYVVQRKKQLSI